MTQDDIDNGRLICEIGNAPVKPAEFVIFRITQKNRLRISRPATVSTEKDDSIDGNQISVQSISISGRDRRHQSGGFSEVSE
jgi:hypothetical protein